MSTPRWLTPKQVEERTGYTVATLATWRSRGKGPPFIRPDNVRAVRYLESDLEKWMGLGKRRRPTRPKVTP